MTSGLHSFFNVFHFGGLWSFSFGFPVDVSCFFHRSGWQPRMIKIFGVGRGKRAEESKDGDSEAVLKNQIPMGPMGCFDGVLDGEFFQAPAAKKKQPGEIRMQKVWVDFMWDWIFGWSGFLLEQNYTHIGHQELDEMELPPQCHIEPPAQKYSTWLWFCVYKWSCSTFWKKIGEGCSFHTNALTAFRTRTTWCTLISRSLLTRVFGKAGLFVAPLIDLAEATAPTCSIWDDLPIVIVQEQATPLSSMLLLCIHMRPKWMNYWMPVCMYLSNATALLSFDD